MKLLKSSGIRKPAWALTLFGVIFLSFILLDNGTSLFTRQGDYQAEDTAKRVEMEVQKPVVLYDMVVDDLHVTEDEVRKNQRFGDLLEGHFVAPSVRQQLNLLPRKIFDFRKIVAGKKYTLITGHDSLQTVNALVYEPNPIDYVVFRFNDSLKVDVCKRDVKTVEKNVTGEIQSSLSETIEEMGISHELTNKFVDIFAWQVDFQHLQRGDKFKLIYEENIVEDRPISVGKILGIYFEHFGNGYYAFPFDQGNGLDYYDEAGKSLRKALLKYPIEFTRISSRYSLSRFHPVVKVFRAHLGTDFAAPTGTPIRSVGDGVVAEAQWELCENPSQRHLFYWILTYVSDRHRYYSGRSGPARSNDRLCGKHGFGNGSSRLLPLLAKWSSGGCLTGGITAFATREKRKPGEI